MTLAEQGARVSDPLCREPYRALPKRYLTTPKEPTNSQQKKKSAAL